MNNLSKKNLIVSISLVCIILVFSAVVIFSFPKDEKEKPKRKTNVKYETSNLQIKNVSDAFVEISKIIKPSVVSITVTTKAKDVHENELNDLFKFFPDIPDIKSQPQIGSGSGVIIRKDGYIVTNNHVVDDANENGIEVVLDNKKKYTAKLIGTDVSTDLAVIKIDETDLSAAAIGNSDLSEVGEFVLAVGNPLGLTSTVTAGIISAIGRGNLGVIQDEKGYGIENFIQTDAAINPGNSGGALVNLNGELIGINTAIASTNARYQGYGFAIPSNLMESVISDLIEHGKVSRGYIGVQIQTIDETMAKALGLEKVQGVLVQVVQSGSAGESAGIQQGDVIISVDGIEVNAANELQSQIAKHHPGETVALKIFRDKKEIIKKVALKSRDDEKDVSQNKNSQDNENKPEEISSKTFDKIGFTLKPLTDEQKKSREVTSGILVSNVDGFSEAAKRGIQKNDIILDADGTKINSTNDFSNVLQSHKNGDSILLRVQKSDKKVSLIAIEIVE